MVKIDKNYCILLLSLGYGNFYVATVIVLLAHLAINTMFDYSEGDRHGA